MGREFSLGLKQGGGSRWVDHGKKFSVSGWKWLLEGRVGISQRVCFCARLSQAGIGVLRFWTVVQGPLSAGCLL